ncbi:MAG TPA: deoxyribose-phosphate aldolase [Eubacterium sp.]|jgi:deoxyribose-phosphate aldolase|nr:deoxyribose-phosphate aldolase [Lachnospiraceae bacterium]HAZ91016.1 deoxyribose-phosphate aldolase [Eubacterium sp.]HBZ52794.1 deoxyribose-phosphate aldolase [Eubacterium sp.]
MEFSKYFDHTILSATATRKDVLKVCQEALKYNFASVCVNSCFVSIVSNQLKGSDVATCAVVGFPLGAMSSAAKAFETRQAVMDGADEIDMVINIGALKAGNLEYVKNDIKLVRNECVDKVLKVIIETAYLSDDEKEIACEIAVSQGADYVKTSTGFATSGATAADVALMKRCVDGKAKVKAAGGIRDYDTAVELIRAGADRIGASRTVEIIAGNR